MQVFFYGLFMDVDILVKNGVQPSNPRMGYLTDYELQIGDRASLIPCLGESAWGMVMNVNEEAIHKLYAAPSVADYLPEEVSVVTDNSEPIEAICYNLPKESLTGTNAAYARSLHDLAVKLGFPAEYLEKIRRMT